MWWRCGLVVAAALGVVGLLSWLSRGGLWALLADTPVLWLLVAGIPLLFVLALLVPDRPWRERDPGPPVAPVIGRVVIEHRYPAELAPPGPRPLPPPRSLVVDGQLVQVQERERYLPPRHGEDAR
jgi:hypothetical protein